MALEAEPQLSDGAAMHPLLCMQVLFGQLPPLPPVVTRHHLPCGQLQPLLHSQLRPAQPAPHLQAQCTRQRHHQ